MASNPFDQFDTDPVQNPFDQFDQPEQPARTAKTNLQDVAATAAKGITGLADAAIGIANIPTLGQAGKAAKLVGLNEVYDDPIQAEQAFNEHHQNIAAGKRNEFMEASPYSAPQQYAQRQVSEADGVLGKLGAAVRYPSTIATTVGESLPTMVAGGLAGRGITAASPLISGVVGGALGEGLMGAGSAAEQTRQQTATGTLTPGQAGMALASGAGTAAFGYAGGKLANKLGIEDVDTLFANGFSKTAKAAGVEAGEKGFAKSAGEVAGRIVGGGVSEGVFEELPQSLQEQMWQNAALGKPLTDGMDEAAAMAILSGGAMGAGVNLMPRPKVQDTGGQNLDTQDGNLTQPADALSQRADAAVAAQDPLAAEPVAPVQPVAPVAPAGPVSKALGTVEPVNPLAQGVGDVQARSRMFERRNNEQSLAANAGQGIPVTPENSVFAQQYDPFDAYGTQGANARADLGYVQRDLEQQAFYDDQQSQQEAQRRAKQDAKDIVNATPEHAAMAEAKKRGGLNLAAFGADYDKTSIGQLSKRYPGLFSANGKVQPDEFANEQGYGSLDEMIQAFLSTGTKNEQAAKAQQELSVQDEMGREADRIQKELGIDLDVPRQMPVGNLEEGDKAVVVGSNGLPDVVTHKGWDADGNVILQDGVTIHADPFDTIRSMGVKPAKQNDDVWVNPNARTGQLRGTQETLPSNDQQGDIAGVATTGDEAGQAPAEVLPRTVGATRAATVKGDPQGFVRDQQIRGEAMGTAPVIRQPGEKLGDYLKRKRDDKEMRQTLSQNETNLVAPGADTAGFIRDQQIRREATATTTSTRQPGESRKAFRERIAEERNQPVQPSEIDNAATEAALSPTNELPEPTDAQKEAGNYRKGHTRIHGLDISIENPAGSVRSGVDQDGKRWEVPIRDHYGYIKGTVGKDKDHIDIFIPEWFEPGNTDMVAVVDQIDPKTGRFDEHKVVMGAADEHSARETYLRNYDQTGKARIGAVTMVPIADFKDWLATGDTKKPVGSISQPSTEASKPTVKESLTVQPTTTQGESNGEEKGQGRQGLLNDGGDAGESVSPSSKTSDKDTATPGPDTSEKGGGVSDNADAGKYSGFKFSKDDVSKELAYRAHAGSSFSPDKRAEQERAGYVEHMKNVIDSLSKHAKTDEQKDELRTWFNGYYRPKYVTLNNALLSANSRTMSSMITGPANFPTRSNQKKLDTAHKRMTELLEWDKSAQDKMRRALSGTTAISSTDSDAIGKLQKKLDSLVKAQDTMKLVNKIVNDKKLSDDEKVSRIVSETSIKEDNAKELLTPDFSGRIGFPSYALQNNNAETRRIKGRITELEARAEKAKEVGGSVEKEFDGGKVEVNYDDGFIRIYHDDKPGKEVRESLKSNGFRWAPSELAWRRKLTTDAKYKTEQITGVKLSQSPTTQGTTVAEGQSELGRYNKSRVQIVQSVEELPDNVKFMTAWHGSPHDFEKFKTSAIGSGEGNQMYGYGLYFASERSVANHYRESLTSNSNLFSLGDYSDYSSLRYLAEYNDVYATEADAKNKRNKVPETESIDSLNKVWVNNKGVVARFDKMPDGWWRVNEGRLYQVELAPLEDEYLLWDRPLSEQSEKVKEALESVGEVDLSWERFAVAMRTKYGQGWASQENRKKLEADELADLERYGREDSEGGEAMGLRRNLTGEDLYRRFAGGSIKGGNARAASEYLHSLGIRGIKYLDGSSRSKGEGAYNYVIFNDQDISVTAKYQQQQGRIQGAYQQSTDTTYLVADNIPSGQWRKVLEHEGLHRAMASGKFDEMLDDLRKMELRFQRFGNGAVPKWFENARAAAQVDRGKAHYIEEIAAYAVAQYEQAPGVIQRWVDRFLAAVKVALRQVFGVMFKVDQAQLREVALYGLRMRSVDQSGERTDMVGGIGGVVPAYASQQSPFKPVDPNSPALQKFLENSQVKEPVFHGSPDEFYIFDRNKLGKNTSSPGTGLGFFFAMDRNESRGYAGPAGETRAFYVDVQNPKRMNASELPKFRGAEEAQAYAKRQQLSGYDGIILEDEGHVIAFESNQVKSAEINTGDFDRGNDDVRYSVAPETTAKYNVTSSNIKGMQYSGVFNNQEALDALYPGAQVTLVREPDNEADPNAVKIQAAGVDIGYVSKSRAVKLAERMDDGENIIGVVSGIYGQGDKTKGTIVFGKPSEVENYKAGQGWNAEGDAKRLAEEERILGKQYSDAIRETLDNGLSASSESSMFEAIGKKLDVVDTADARLKTKAYDWFKSLTPAAARHGLGAMTLSQLREVFGDKIPEMATYFQASKDIAADANRIMSKGQEIHDQWAKLKKDDARNMSETMIRATVAGVNPDAERFEPRANIMRLRQAMNKSLNRIAELRANGEQVLSEDEKRELTNLEIKVRQQAERIKNEANRRKEYTELSKLYSSLSNDAKAVYQAVKNQYTNNLNALFEAVRERIERQTKDPKLRKTTIDTIRERYDKYIKEGPYFPLSRFGDYIAVAENGGQREVRTFDTMAERKRYTRERRAQGWKVQEKTAKEYSKETQGASGSFITGLVGAIEDNPELSSAAKKNLIDEVNQHFIKALPDLSHRKHFAHRRKVEGYNRDQMRAFADNMQHAAHHISRIRHADKMSTAVESILESAKMAPKDANVDDYTDLHNELVKRLAIMNNPNISPVAQALTSFGFLMHIGPSIASTVTNMTQTPLVAFPIMSTWFKKQGAASAFTALKNASADYFTSKPKWATGPSLIENKKLPQHERDAIAKLIDDGTIETSMSMSIAQAAGEDFLNLARTKHGNTMLKIMRLTSYPFHIAELANRKITALAAYRMARAEGQDFNTAVNTARDIVLAGHFDYSRHNRARFMEGNVQRVLFLFKQYSQQMTWLLVRSFYQATKGESAEVKSAARKRLGMILAGHFSVAGAMGLPVVGSVLGAISMLGGDDDDPMDAEVSLRNWMADTFGKTAGEAVMNGPWRMLPGLGEIDLSSRVSLGDLWFRAPEREAEGMDKFNQYLNLAIGPLASSAANVFMGLNAMNNGEGWRGIEMMLPKAAKDTMKSIRYARDGVTNWKHDTLIDELGTVELMAQAFGFTPSRISEMYSGANAVKNREARLTNRRQVLMNQWVQAMRSRDAESAREAMDAIVEFNKINPVFRVNGESLRRSLINRRKAEANTKKGVYLPATRNELRDYGRFANLD